MRSFASFFLAVLLAAASTQGDIQYRVLYSGIVAPGLDWTAIPVTGIVSIGSPANGEDVIVHISDDSATALVIPDEDLGKIHLQRSGSGLPARWGTPHP